MTRRALVIPASGLGDALIMSIAFSKLEQEGFEVHVAHRLSSALSPFFPSTIHWHYGIDHIDLFNYQLILMQCDHSELFWRLHHIRLKQPSFPLRVFYPKPSKTLQPLDYLCKARRSLREELIQYLNRLLPGSWTPSHHIEHVNPTQKNQVLLHPFSANPEKNWPLNKYLALAKKLKELGYDTTLLKGKTDPRIPDDEHSVQCTETLAELKEVIHNHCLFIGNDSGPGHFASFLGLPTLTIGYSMKHLKRWRPTFSKSYLLAPPLPLPNFKGIGLTIRSQYWHDFISVNKVVKKAQQVLA